MAIRGRGSNTHGKGTHRRGKGRKGGQGGAGSNDSRWMSTLKTSARHSKHGHLGKYGFTRGSLSKNPETVNLNWVSEHFDSKVDLTSLGIEKLLGTGRLAKPLKIKVNKWSKRVEEKVKAAGGEISQ